MIIQVSWIFLFLDIHFHIFDIHSNFCSLLDATLTGVHFMYSLRTVKDFC